MTDYKLWACKPTRKNMKALQAFPHFKAGPQYCLVIAEQGPEGAVAIEGEYTNLLTAADWDWILQTRDELLLKDEAAHREELSEARERFLERFRTELMKRREEENNAGDAQRGDRTAE